VNTIAARFTWFYALSQLKLKYRYTALGFLWNFLEPALFLVVLSLVFSVVNRMDIGDYAVFLFSALVPWRYFEKTVNTCMDSIVGGDWLLKKMFVSPIALPLARWVIAGVEFVFSMAAVLVILAFLKDSWSIHLLILPLAIVPWSLLGLGVGLTCAVLFTFFRDVRPVVQMALMLAFFSSPILFKADLFAEHSVQSLIVRWHPITYFAALLQKPIYYAQLPDTIDWCVSFTLGILSVALGFSLINKFKGRFYYYL
jgi:ABC-type polysaccharide/polyol phosphate export permease